MTQLLPIVYLVCGILVGALGASLAYRYAAKKNSEEMEKLRRHELQREAARQEHNAEAKRKRQLIAKKEELYLEIIKGVSSAVFDNSDYQILASYLRALTSDCLLYGSSEMVDLLIEAEETTVKRIAGDASAMVGRILYDITNQARKEIGVAGLFEGGVPEKPADSADQQTPA